MFQLQLVKESFLTNFTQEINKFKKICIVM